MRIYVYIHIHIDTWFLLVWFISLMWLTIGFMLGPAHIVGKLGVLEMSRKIIVEPCGFPLKPCGKSWDMISVHCVETKTETARKTKLVWTFYPPEMESCVKKYWSMHVHALPVSQQPLCSLVATCIQPLGLLHRIRNTTNHHTQKYSVAGGCKTRRKPCKHVLQSRLLQNCWPTKIWKTYWNGRGINRREWKEVDGTYLLWRAHWGFRYSLNPLVALTRHIPKVVCQPACRSGASGCNSSPAATTYLKKILQ